ncbi:MAG: FmdB family zinc ribbon protein [Beijerinckiaceae bacterium]
MPVYDYVCVDCGPFSELKPMSAWSDPCGCPLCGQSCERAILRAPFIAGMDPTKRTAFAVNERSAHEPQLSRNAQRVHAAGCACCRPLSRKTKTSPSGAKSFPTARPWMISH